MEIDVLTSSFLGLRDKLHHIALNYLESDEDAKDALQDTWLKLPLDAVSVREMKGYNIVEEDLKHLETLLQEGLTPLQREIFNLVTHEGMEYEQVAEKLSMSVEAVRMNMSRTRKKMRETYNQLNR